MWDYELVEVCKTSRGKECEILKHVESFDKPVYKIRYVKGKNRKFWYNSSTKFYHYDTLKAARNKIKRT